MSQTEQQINSRAQFIRADFVRRYGSTHVIIRMMGLLSDADLVKRADAHHAQKIASQAAKKNRAHEAKSVSLVGQRGYFLLELLVGLMIVMILAAVAIPNMVIALAVKREAGAFTYLQQVSQAQIALNICATTPTCTPALGLSSVLPAPGAYQQNGYTFTVVASPWSITAVPLDNQYEPNAIFVDSSGILRCWPGLANAGSPACE